VPGGLAGENVIETTIGARDETAAGISSASMNLDAFAKKAADVGKKMMATGTVTTAAMIGLQRSTVMYGESVDKMAKKTGLTTDEVQKLSYAADMEHASIESLSKSMPLLTRNMAAAAEGNQEAKKSFADMGIEVTDAQGKLRPVGDVLLNIADYMKNSNDETGKLALSTKILGRSGGELLPFLEMGSEAINAYGEELKTTRGILGPEAVSDLENFGDSVTAANATIAGLKDQIAISMLPTFRDLLGHTRALAEWFKGMDPGLKQFIATGALVAGIGLMIGGGVLFATAKVIQLVGWTQATIAWLRLLGPTGATNIGMLTGAMGGLLAITVGLIAAEEALMSLKGMWQAHRAGSAAKKEGAQVDEIRRQMESGEISKEEARLRLNAVSNRGVGLRTQVGSATWGMTGAERIGHEMGRYNRIAANFSFTKEDDIGKMVNNTLKPALAAQ